MQFVVKEICISLTDTGCQEGKNRWLECFKVQPFGRRLAKP